MSKDYQNYDPYEQANNPALPDFKLWGRIFIDAWACALVKGVGRERFDPNKHTRPFTAIDIVIDPLPELKITNKNICERHMLAESRDWINITLASLKKLGIQDIRQANEKWGKVDFEPTGGTYEKDGKTKNETAFKFLALYDTEEQCRKAFESGEGDLASEEISTDEKRMTAWAFAKVLTETGCRGVKNKEEAKKKIAPNLAQYPAVNEYFTIDSPEILALIEEIINK